MRPFADFRRFAEDPLEDALNRVSQTDRFRDQFLKGLARALASSAQNSAAQGFPNHAEAAILRHLSQGYSNKEIARLIGKSPDTVKYRLKSIFRKLGVSKRRDAVRVSHEMGLVAPAAGQSAGARESAENRAVDS